MKAMRLLSIIALATCLWSPWADLNYAIAAETVMLSAPPLVMTENQIKSYTMDISMTAPSKSIADLIKKGGPDAQSKINFLRDLYKFVKGGLADTFFQHLREWKRYKFFAAADTWLKWISIGLHVPVMAANFLDNDRAGFVTAVDALVRDALKLSVSASGLAIGAAWGSSGGTAAGMWVGTLIAPGPGTAIGGFIGLVLGGAIGGYGGSKIATGLMGGGYDYVLSNKVKDLAGWIYDSLKSPPDQGGTGGPNTGTRTGAGTGMGTATGTGTSTGTGTDTGTGQDPGIFLPGTTDPNSGTGTGKGTGTGTGTGTGGRSQKPVSLRPVKIYGQ